MPSVYSVIFKSRTMKNIKYTIVLFWLLLSCNKLDIKPDLSRVVPSTLEDFQGVLDNSQTIFNLNFNSFGEIAANDFYVSYEDYQANPTPLTSEIYIWNIDKLDDPYFSDWNSSYSKILNCNIVLEGLENNFSTKINEDEVQNIKGQALFHRALSFFMLAQEFAPVFDNLNLDKPAIPLRTASDINLNYPLSSVRETYKLILEDLKMAVTYLPPTSKYKTRPSRAAALGLLARIYLSMDDYLSALHYAEESLAISSDLLNYNDLNELDDYPISQFNREVIFHGTLLYDDLLIKNAIKVQPDLYALYEVSDLRKKLFFIENIDGSYTFKGNYNGLDDYLLFGGIATDEIILIKAECHARLNQISEALLSLNALLVKRHDIKSFVTINITNQDELLRRVLDERRKELLFRGLRWNDLRRLNKDPRFAVTLTRELNGKTYSLPPNDPRYVFRIPKYVSTITY